jgi:DNA-binding ferritin-like protein (Dps family)
MFSINFGKLKYTKILIFVFILFILSELIINIYNSNIYRSELRQSNRFSGDKIYSPYTSGDKKWKKVALHLHSDRVFFSFVRHTPEEINRGYINEKYSGIVITDYMQITDVSHIQGWNLPGYEWGCNSRKRHILTLGSNTVVPDPFPIFSRSENLQWAIDQMKTKNSFTVINHPYLHKSFTKEEIAELSDYNAIEVISVFGNSIELLDYLLTRGRPVFAMSTDDLHYFSDSVVKELKTPLWKNKFQKLARFEKESGESMKRFVMIDAQKIDSDSIFKNLCSGNYISVEKLHTYLPDPDIGVISMDKNNVIHISFNGLPGNIKVTGEYGKELFSQFSVKEISFPIPETEPFVRVTLFHNQAMVLLNPFFRYKEGMFPISCGEKKRIL